MTHTPCDFFVSYTQVDAAWAEWIAWELEEAEYTTRLMAWDFRPGQSFAHLMHEALQACRHLILVLSPAYLQSEFSASEWEAAFVTDPRGRDRKLIPVRVAPCDPPGLLARLVYVELVGLSQEESRKRLLAGIRQGRAKPPARSGFPGRENAPWAQESPGRLAPSYPAALPATWTVPLPQNPFFVGRDRVLDDLAQWLDRETVVERSVVLCGLGGVGKTQVAVEYAHRFRELYQAVLWVRADGPASVRADLALLAGEAGLGLVPREVRDEPTRLEALRRWLQSNDGWLLIFDNVDDPDSAREVMRAIPAVGEGDVLITSRMTDWPPTVSVLELELLRPADAERFLSSRAERAGLHADPETAGAIASVLGYLPLALEQAASYLLKHRIGFDEYLMRLTRSRERLLAAHSPGATAYPASVATTWTISEERLGVPAQALLGLLAWLAPEELPRVVLHLGAGAVRRAMELTAAGGLDGSAPDEEMIDSALAELADYSLVRLRPSAVLCHRLVQGVRIDRLRPEERSEWVKAALELLNSVAPMPANDVRVWPAWTLLRPHVLSVIGHAETTGRADLAIPLMTGLALFEMGQARYAEAERLFRRVLDIHSAGGRDESADAIAIQNSLAELLRTAGRFAEAEPLLRRAVAVNKRLEHPAPIVAVTLNNLALVLWETNRHREAEPLLRRTLQMAEELSGPDSLDVALALNNLGEVLRTLHRLTDAEALFRRAISIEESVRGPLDPNLARALNNLGLLLMTASRLAEAEQLLTRALEINERGLGPKHPAVTTSLNNVAELLKATNRQAEAEPLLRRALAIDEAVFGPSHHAVARDLVNLATLLHARNRLDEAEPMYHRALEVSVEHFGPDHPAVATARTSLAGFLLARERFEQAEASYRRALEIDEASFGEAHPSIARDLVGLALVLQTTNRSDEAERLYRRALHIAEASSGPDHPSVSTVLTSLAELLRGLGHYKAAEPLYQRSVAICEAAFPPNHPTIAVAVNNLGLLCLETNRLQEADKHFTRALQAARTSYGDAHPLVAQLLSNLGECWRLQRRAAEAEPLFQQALAIHEKSFGPHHLTVATGLNQLGLCAGENGAFAQAANLFERAQRIYEDKLGPEHPHVARSLSNRAEMARAQGQIREAVALGRRAVALDEAGLGSAHPRVAMDLNNLGLALAEAGEWTESRNALERSVEIASSSLGVQHPFTMQYAANLAAVKGEGAESE